MNVTRALEVADGVRGPTGLTTADLIDATHALAEAYRFVVTDAPTPLTGELLLSAPRFVRIGEFWLNPDHVVAVGPTDDGNTAIELVTGRSVGTAGLSSEEVVALLTDEVAP